MGLPVKVVETGWDPGARRDALMPREAAPTPVADAGAGRSGAGGYARIAPPAGAPAPPPPEAK
ncbi:hypothetical protein ABCR94_12325 [Streptomyces sp. 21So2-11]|uniref:hypothetical protein n=1 Tax=Streptomyces sp. 21So2-11 TaxID=3144408 RepID=UPI00321C3038